MGLISDGSYLYWSGLINGSYGISRINKNGSPADKPTIIYSGIDQFESIYDFKLTTTYIYLLFGTTIKRGEIKENSTPNNLELLYSNPEGDDIINPSSITISPKGDYIYWISGNSRIVRGHFDGKGASQVIKEFTKADGGYQSISVSNTEAGASRRQQPAIYNFRFRTKR